MADVKWIKLATNLFDNRKIRQIECLPDGDSIIVIWVKLMCLAGNINDSGFVYFTKEIPYTDQMLAAQFNRPLTTIQFALKTFEQFGMIELIDNVLHISNWEKYQNIEGLDKIREQNRLRKAAQRERQKALVSRDSHVTVTQGHATEEDKEEDKEIDKEYKKKKEKKKPEQKTFSDNSELNQAILNFIDFRKGIKKPMTDHAVELLIQKLNSMTSSIPEQIEIINQSIVNGWQGVFPLKEPTQQKKGNHQPNMNSPAYNNSLKADMEWLKNFDEKMKNPPKTAAEDERIRQRAEELKKMFE